MARIVILVHREASFNDALYFLRPISDLWREQGHSVDVLCGPDKFVDADLAILHVDLTVVSDDYIEFMHRYPKTINSGVRDISKSSFSTNHVRRDDGYQGAVIVKTERNCGGCSEAHINHNHSLYTRYTNSLIRRLPWAYSGEIKTANYPIYDSTTLVPRPVWRNSRLIVEKFLPERRGDLYCLRTWVFLGDRDSSSLCTSPKPIVKGADFMERFAVDVPDELRKIRKDLKFDFGKFDYALVDGEVVLYDVNRTPTLGDTPEEMYMPRAKVLAEGLQSILDA